MASLSVSRLVYLLFVSALCTAFLLLLSGCSSDVKRPVLYPNAHYQQVGAEGAQQATNDCWERAWQYGLNERAEGRKTRSAATGAAVAGAAAGAYGLVRGDAGKRAAAGAAAGASGGATRAAVTEDDPPPLFRAFINRCLSEQQFEVMGWQ